MANIWKRARPEELQEISTNFYSSSISQDWKEPFNDATFFNYDTVNPLFIQKWELPPAIVNTTNGHVYPSALAIELKVGCVNGTNFTMDTKGSTTGSWRIIFTQYLGVG